jgi:hypothetical protein
VDEHRDGPSGGIEVSPEQEKAARGTPRELQLFGRQHEAQKIKTLSPQVWATHTDLSDSYCSNKWPFPESSVDGKLNGLGLPLSWFAAISTRKRHVSWHISIDHLLFTYRGRWTFQIGTPMCPWQLQLRRSRMSHSVSIGSNKARQDTIMIRQVPSCKVVQGAV